MQIQNNLLLPIYTVLAITYSHFSQLRCNTHIIFICRDIKGLTHYIQKSDVMELYPFCFNYLRSGNANMRQWIGSSLVKQWLFACSVPSRYLDQIEPFSSVPHFNVMWIHDDITTWKHFPRYWPFVCLIYRSPMNSPHKDPWRGALMFSLICAWINGWVNNREADDLRCYRAHYDATIMYFLPPFQLPSLIMCIANKGTPPAPDESSDETNVSSYLDLLWQNY